MQTNRPYVSVQAHSSVPIWQTQMVLPDQWHFRFRPSQFHLQLYRKIQSYLKFHFPDLGQKLYFYIQANPVIIAYHGTAFLHFLLQHNISIIIIKELLTGYYKDFLTN